MRLIQKHTSTKTMTSADIFLPVYDSNLNKDFISFQFLIGDIITENNLLKRYPKVRYQFNVLNANDFRSDYKKIKLIFKHLIINVFKSSGMSNDTLVNIDVTCNEKQSNIIVRTNKVIENRASKSFFQKLFNRIGLSRNVMSGLNLVSAIVEKLQGSFSISISAEAGTVVNIVIPNLTINKYENLKISHSSSRSISL